jgi:hypothetical protein
VRGVQGIGGHAKPNKGESVIWLSPESIVRSLGIFDLDPCAAPSPRPWTTARKHIELPDNGLIAKWESRVWLNPPYDENLERWMQRMAEHRFGISLLFARTEIEVWHRWIWPYADSILFISRRLHFHYPDGRRARGNSGGPSALIAYSGSDSQYLENSGIPGAIVEVKSCRGGNGKRGGYPAGEFTLVGSSPADSTKKETL